MLTKVKVLTVVEMAFAIKIKQLLFINNLPLDKPNSTNYVNCCLYKYVQSNNCRTKMFMLFAGMTATTE